MPACGLVGRGPPRPPSSSRRFQPAAKAPPAENAGTDWPIEERSCVWRPCGGKKHESSHEVKETQLWAGRYPHSYSDWTGFGWPNSP